MLNNNNDPMKYYQHTYMQRYINKRLKKKKNS